MNFLRALARNNRREWFQEHKEAYLQTVKEPMEEFVLAMGEEFARFAPEFLATPKASAYRIYRDTRFSADKTPYKTHAGAVFPCRGLGKHGGAGFYVHVSAEQLFVGGGLYMPAPADLLAVREHLARKHHLFRKRISAKTFTERFGSLSGEQLTRVPRGFPKDHPGADLLRRKQFLAMRPLEPMLAMQRQFFEEAVESFQVLLPVLRFLNEPILHRHSSVVGDA